MFGNRQKAGIVFRHGFRGERLEFRIRRLPKTDVAQPRDSDENRKVHLRDEHFDTFDGRAGCNRSITSATVDHRTACQPGHTGRGRKGICLCTPLRKLMAVAAVTLAWIPSMPAADLIYVAIDDDTVVSYDISLGNATAVQNSKSVYADSTYIANPRGIAFDASNNPPRHELYGEHDQQVRFGRRVSVDDRFSHQPEQPARDDVRFGRQSVCREP